MGGAQAARRAAGGRRHDGASGCERRRIGEGAGPPSRRRTLGPRGGSRPALARREDGGEGRGRGPGGSGFKLPLVSLCSVRRPRAGARGGRAAGSGVRGWGSVCVCVGRGWAARASARGWGAGLRHSAATWGAGTASTWERALLPGRAPRSRQGPAHRRERPRSTRAAPERRGGRRAATWWGQLPAGASARRQPG